MAMQPQFSLIHSEFNEFLFAAVGEEITGSELTVLSALARLDLDPWSEAERLSALPKEKAARALEALIATLPAGRWKVSDLPVIAARLVDFLPGRRVPAVPLPASKAGVKPSIKWINTALVVAVLVTVIINILWHLHTAPISKAVSGMPTATLMEASVINSPVVQLRDDIGRDAAPAFRMTARSSVPSSS